MLGMVPFSLLEWQGWSLPPRRTLCTPGSKRAQMACRQEERGGSRDRTIPLFRTLSFSQAQYLVVFMLHRSRGLDF